VKTFEKCKQGNTPKIRVERRKNVQWWTKKRLFG